MTFFYDLNKKLASIGKPTEQLNERRMREGSIQGGVWTADPPKPGQPNVPVPQNPDGGSIKSTYTPPAPGSAIKVTPEPKSLAPAPKSLAPAPTPTKEELVGGQKKLDKNANGKLDAQDFAMLRKSKKQTSEGDFGPMEGSTGDYSAKKARAGKDIGKPGKEFSQIADKAGKKYGSKEAGERVAGAVLAKLRAKESVAEADMDESALQAYLGKKKYGADGMKALQKAGRDGASKETMAKIRAKHEVDEGWDDMLKDVERRRSGMKTGEKVQGHKGEIEKTATGIKHTRKYDPKTGETDSGDDDAPKGEKRRGRPKGTGKAMGAKGPSGKSKLMKKEGFDITTPSGTFSTNTGTMTPPPMPESKGDDVKAAMTLLKKAGYKVTKADAKEPVEEKAVSKAQQKFMGMVHATQKGEKAPSKEVAKVAKSMKKSDAEDFAATKHKGLPEKKKKKTEEAGGVDTPTASSGFSFGKGIYDSINRELEEMIAESMNISMNSNSDGANGPTKSLTVTATDEDAAYLAQILKSAGLGGGSHGDCGCGDSPCSCGSDAEHVDENKPDWPTNTEYSDDALQYSGGLNKPKTDVAGDGQTTVPVAAVHTQDEDELRRLREMAGIAETKKVDEDDMEEGNKFTGNLAKARAAGKKEADLDGDGDMEKVKESILDMKHLWTEYKG